ncbi:GTPase HflX, partial [Myxococcota bacterium]|nr:GTPase HflX [Myxococcota bacterium]
MDAREIISADLAREMVFLSRDIGRQIGVFLSRRGRVESVFVGDSKQIYLPDPGRQRVGLGHFRGLRAIHTVFENSDKSLDALSRDDITDLKKLRLDLVGALKIKENGELGRFSYAHLLPVSRDSIEVQYENLPTIFELDVDFLELIKALEEEFGRYTTKAKKTDGRIQALIAGVYSNRALAKWRLDELKELADTAGVNVQDTMIQVRKRVDPKYVVGKGKLEEIVLRCLDEGADLLIFDHNLTPAQARAIAAFSDLKVIDRTQLILDIFAQHATSRDGKVQVELAQLKYNLPRLTDMDAGLSRLTGGIGGQGPGETKLEINRRRARDRISRLEREIKNLSKRRQLRRGKRQRNNLPV